MKFGFLLLKKNFDKIIYRKVRAKKQKKGGSYYGKIKNFEFIDWKKSSEFIEALVRVRAKTI